MGYLVCEKCGGQYELAENEVPDDFSDKCECGGKLTYIDRSNKPKTALNPQVDGDKYLIPCPHCNFGNNTQAQFCKKCGKSLKLNLISRFNNDLNLFAVFIGLAVSCIVLIIGSFFFGAIVAAASIDISIYVAIVLMFMVFFGGTTTGIVGCSDVKEGAKNGIFMSLIALVILGFVVGVVLFVTMGIAAAISSALQPYSSSMASSSPWTITGTTSSDTDSLEFVFTIIKGIIIIVLVLISGAVGGSFGVFLKNGVKN